MPPIVTTKRFPLHDAAYNGRLADVERLLDSGTDVNARAWNNWTPLHRTAEEGHVEIAQVLLERGATVDAKDVDGDTPLLIAAEYGHVDVVALLLAAGGDPLAHDAALASALHKAAFAGHATVIDVLVDATPNVDERDNEEDTPILLAGMNGNLDCVSALIEHGADVNARNKDNQTLLHLAAAEGDMELVRLLIDNGALFKAKGKDRDTPLHMAAARGHIDIVKALLDEGAPIFARNKFNKTPLDLAKEQPNNTAVMDFLKDAERRYCQPRRSGSASSRSSAGSSRHLLWIRRGSQNIAISAGGASSEATEHETPEIPWQVLLSRVVSLKAVTEILADPTSHISMKPLERELEEIETSLNELRVLRTAGSLHSSVCTDMRHVLLNKVHQSLEMANQTSETLARRLSRVRRCISRSVEDESLSAVDELSSDCKDDVDELKAALQSWSQWEEEVNAVSSDLMKRGEHTLTLVTECARKFCQHSAHGKEFACNTKCRFQDILESLNSDHGGTMIASGITPIAEDDEEQ